MLAGQLVRSGRSGRGVTDGMAALFVKPNGFLARHENANRTRAELTAEILREYKRFGNAMRYLSVEGKIAWKATQLLLQKLADAEREVEDDMEDLP